MRTDNFRASVDEIRRNGGRRQAMYIREAWRDREMTVFTYSDNTAEVFEDAHPYMAFNSEAEAVLTISRMQCEYDRMLEESGKAFTCRQAAVKVKSCTIAEWYATAPRGTYFGD